MRKRVTRVLTCGLWGSLMAAGLAGCASDDDLRPVSIVHQAHPVSEPPRTAPNGATGQDVAVVTLTNTNIRRWEEIADQLGKFQFDLSQETLLSMGSQTTSSAYNANLDAQVTTLAATLAGRSINHTADTQTDASGTTTTTTQLQSALATPTAPGAPTVIIQGTPVTAAMADGKTGVDAATQMRNAAALAEEVAIINQRVQSVPVPKGYRPYFASFQLEILPNERGYPYDTSVDIAFETNSQSVKTDLEKSFIAQPDKDTEEAILAAVDAVDAVAGTQDIPATTVTATSTNTTAAATTITTTVTTTITAPAGVAPPPASSKKIIVLPLLVTDTIEESQVSDTANTIRELALGLQASGGIFGGNAGLQKTLSSLAQSQSLRPNSLSSIAVGSASNIVHLRLGAQNFGEEYEMSTGNRTFSVLLFVPSDIAVASVKAAQEPGAASKTDANTRSGAGSKADTTATSDVDTPPFPIKYSARLTYSDAMAQLHRLKKGADHPDNTPYASLTTTVLPATWMSVPRIEQAQCPDAQTALVTPANLNLPADPLGASQTEPVGVVRLIGGKGFTYRRIEATFETDPVPAPKVKAAKPKKDKNGKLIKAAAPAPSPFVPVKSMTLKAIDVRPVGNSLVMFFPDYGNVFPRDDIAQTRSAGKVKIRIYANDTLAKKDCGDGISVGEDQQPSHYDLAYVVPAKAAAPAADAPAATPGKGAAAPAHSAQPDKSTPQTLVPAQPPKQTYSLPFHLTPQ